MSAFWEQNWKMFTSETNAGKATEAQGACYLRGKHQARTYCYSLTCLWASAKLKGSMPSSRGAIRSMSAKVMRLNRANIANNDKAPDSLNSHYRIPERSFYHFPYFTVVLHYLVSFFPAVFSPHLAPKLLLLN